MVYVEERTELQKRIGWIVRNEQLCGWMKCQRIEELIKQVGDGLW